MKYKKTPSTPQYIGRYNYYEIKKYTDEIRKELRKEYKKYHSKIKPNRKIICDICKEKKADIFVYMSGKRWFGYCVDCYIKVRPQLKKAFSFFKNKPNQKSLGEMMENKVFEKAFITALERVCEKHNCKKYSNTTIRKEVLYK